MKKLLIIMTISLLCVQGVWAQSATSKTLANIARKASKSLAAVKIEAKRADGSTSELIGLAFCIDSKGLFVTLGVPTSARAEDIGKIELLPAGDSQEVFPAEFVGLDQASGMAFIQAIGGNWTAVKLASKPNLSVGQEVISAGLLIGPGARPVSVGLAYVSSIIEIPTKIAYVTGGKLTIVGSPVFTPDGKVVGLVDRQLAIKSRIKTPNGQVTMVESEGYQETSFFTLIDHYADVLGNIPTGVRKLPWLGMGKIDAVVEEIAMLRGLEKVGLIVEQVFPGHPASNAGIHDRDIIVQVNGEDLKDFGGAGMNVEAFTRTIARIPIGKTVDLTVLRSDGQTFTATVTLASQPPLPKDAPLHRSETMGTILREKVPLDQHLLEGPAASEAGLIVRLVAQGGPADVAGLKATDLVTKVNAEPITTIAQFEEIIGRGEPTDPVSLTVRRGSETIEIRIFPRIR